MAGNLCVGVRYCGGCNPRFDRTALVAGLARQFPDLSLVPAQPGVDYPAVLVVCGCLSACAGTDDLPPDRRICISAPAELPRAAARLRALSGENGPQS